MPDFIGLSIKPHNDIEIDADGNLVMVTDAEAIGQHVRQRLMFWLNEWTLNPAAGVDWTRYVLGRPSSEQPIAEAVIKREILNTPGVAEILSFDASYDARSRGLRINSVEMLTVFDDILELQF